MIKLHKNDIARSIDHAILAPNTTKETLIQELGVAKLLNLYSVCVRPDHVRSSVAYLQGSNTKVGTVIGFPHGSNENKIKVFETEVALRHGAKEIDFVLNISDIKDHNWQKIIKETKEIVEASKDFGAEMTKAIFENAYLTHEEIIKLSSIMSETRVDFIKTSTGFASSGAKLEEVELMINNRTSDKLQVKASGGIRNLTDLIQFRQLGVTRFGTSNSLAILEDFEKIQESDRNSNTPRNDY